MEKKYTSDSNSEYFIEERLSPWEKKSIPFTQPDGTVVFVTGYTATHVYLSDTSSKSRDMREIIVFPDPTKRGVFWLNSTSRNPSFFVNEGAFFECRIGEGGFFYFKRLHKIENIFVEDDLPQNEYLDQVIWANRPKGEPFVISSKGKRVYIKHLFLKQIEMEPFGEHERIVFFDGVPARENASLSIFDTDRWAIIVKNVGKDGDAFRINLENPESPRYTGSFWITIPEGIVTKIYAPVLHLKDYDPLLYNFLNKNPPQPPPPSADNDRQ